MADTAAGRSPLPIFLVVVVLNLGSTAGGGVPFTTLAPPYSAVAYAGHAGWEVTSYLLLSALSAALCGRLGDLLGQRLMVLTILGLCGAGSLLSALATSLPWIIAGCVLQGTAGALTPLSIGIARESLPRERVPF